MVGRFNKTELLALAVIGLVTVATGAFASQFVDESVRNDRISHELALDLMDAHSDQMVTCLVILESSPVLFHTGGIPIPELINQHKHYSYSLQNSLLEEMNAENSESIQLLERHWLLNCMEVRGKPKDIKRLARKKKVKKLSRGGSIRLIEPSRGSSPWPDGETSPWNVMDIGTPEAWAAGYDGKGVVIGHLDTGVDVSHPALNGKFAGHWFDAIKGVEQPYDDHGHGTHTMGTLLGGDGLGAWPHDMGIAPGATWVGAKVLDENGVGTYKQCLAGLEFMAELKKDVDIRIVCGSWSLDEEGQDLLADVCRILLDLGILPVFAVGNDGPEPRTAEVPGSYPSVLGVGALDEFGQPADFSSRGPAPEIPWADGAMPLDPEWQGHKPDMSAPGVRILSCGLNNDYTMMSGTSMAAPHVAGAAALLLDKNDTLSPRALTLALINSAQSVPGLSNVPENTCGWGSLDIIQALDSVDPVGRLQAAAVTRPPTGGLALEVSTSSNLTRIRYTLGSDRNARLDVYDLAGRRIRSLPVSLAGNSREVIWRGKDSNGRQVTSGVYLVRLDDGRHSIAKTCVIVR
jgi:hypothetical protein